MEQQVDFVKDLYAAVDKATDSEVDRLKREVGVVPSCKKGCSQCCRQHIPIREAEADILVEFIKQEFSEKQINDLRLRTKQWHEWDQSQTGRKGSVDGDRVTLRFNNDPFCPMLVDHACSIYPARPFVCRTHLVSSHPKHCSIDKEYEITDVVPEVLKTVLKVTRPFAKALTEHAEDAGLDSSRTTLLLPHWLAIKMEWDFAVAL